MKDKAKIESITDRILGLVMELEDLSGMQNPIIKIQVQPRTLRYLEFLQAENRDQLRMLYTHCNGLSICGVFIEDGPQ